MLKAAVLSFQEGLNHFSSPSDELPTSVIKHVNTMSCLSNKLDGVNAGLREAVASANREVARGATIDNEIFHDYLQAGGQRNLEACNVCLQDSEQDTMCTELLKSLPTNDKHPLDKNFTFVKKTIVCHPEELQGYIDRTKA